MKDSLHARPPVSYTHLDVYKRQRMRCPHATILGTAKLKCWELLFKGSKTGSYLTIKKSEGGTVPVSYTHLDVYKRQGKWNRTGWVSGFSIHADCL